MKEIPHSRPHRSPRAQTCRESVSCNLPIVARDKKPQRAVPDRTLDRHADTVCRSLQRSHFYGRVEPLRSSRRKSWSETVLRPGASVAHPLEPDRMIGLKRYNKGQEASTSDRWTEVHIQTCL